MKLIKSNAKFSGYVLEQEGIYDKIVRDLVVDFAEHLHKESLLEVTERSVAPDNPTHMDSKLIEVRGLIMTHNELQEITMHLGVIDAVIPREYRHKVDRIKELLADK